MPIQKRKEVGTDRLSPTQFLVHQDIVDQKAASIQAGGKPSVHVRPHPSGMMTVEDGHHAAAAYAQLGRKVPVTYSLQKPDPYEPSYEWDDVHTVHDSGPVDHPVIGRTEWEDR
jgi:hypothetical protein